MRLQNLIIFEIAIFYKLSVQLIIHNIIMFSNSMRLKNNSVRVDFYA